MKKNTMSYILGRRGIRIVLPLCIAVSVCGCNKDNGGSNPSGVGNSGPGDSNINCSSSIIDNSDSSTLGNSADDGKASVDDQLVESFSELNEELADDISISVDDAALDYSDIDEESRNLYRSFLTGEADALVMDTCSESTLEEWFLESFPAQSTCSLKQITDKFYEIENVKYDDKTVGSYIDCGLDGNYEFLIQVRYINSGCLNIILKNIDGKLYICFVAEGWERKAVDIGENGEFRYCCNENGTLHVGKDYYIDADGVCHFYEYGGFDTIDVNLHVDDDTDSILKTNDVESVNFGFFSSSVGSSTPTYCYGIDIEIDNDFIDRTDETEELFLEAERLLEERGYTVISDEEAEELMREGRESVGLTEEIYNADVAYYSN